MKTEPDVIKLPDQGVSVIESMSRIPFGKAFIRVWREELEIQTSYPDTVFELRSIAREMQTDKEDHTTRDVVLRLLAIDRVNAVEFTNGHGNGVVLYKTWP
jgi:hypothetical protein